MTEIHDLDRTGYSVPVKKLPNCLLFAQMPVGNMFFGDEEVPVEITSAVPNGSIVVGIGDKKKRYYIVKTIDIVYAAYHADRAMRGLDQQDCRSAPLSPDSSPVEGEGL
jgi:hypothetical protein